MPTGGARTEPPLACAPLREPPLPPFALSESPEGLEEREEEAPVVKARPKTAAVKDNLWGGDGEQLDDLDDGGIGPPENFSQRGPIDDARTSKRRALFGGVGASAGS